MTLVLTTSSGLPDPAASGLSPVGAERLALLVEVSLSRGLASRPGSPGRSDQHRGFPPLSGAAPSAGRGAEKRAASSLAARTNPQRFTPEPPGVLGEGAARDSAAARPDMASSHLPGVLRDQGCAFCPLLVFLEQ